MNRVGLHETARAGRVASPQLPTQLAHGLQPLDLPQFHGPRLQRVVQVVQHRRQPVGQRDRLHLERRRQSRPCSLELVRGNRMVGTTLDDALAHRVGQVQARVPVAFFQMVHDSQSLPGSREPTQVAQPRAATPVQAAGQQVVQRPLAGGTEGRLAQVVAQRDRFDQILVEPQRAPDRSRQLGYFQRVGQSIAAMVLVGRQDAGLGLLTEPAKRPAVDDPVAITLKGGAVVERPPLVLDRPAPGCLARAHRPGRQQPRLGPLQSLSDHLLIMPRGPFTEPPVHARSGTGRKPTRPGPDCPALPVRGPQPRFGLVT